MNRREISLQSVSGTRAELYRKQALEAESKAFTASTENSRRAWLIVARDWTKMAEREELKYLPASEAKLAPESDIEALEDAIRRFAATTIAKRER